jgi:hypothetical protein
MIERMDGAPDRVLAFKAVSLISADPARGGTFAIAPDDDGIVVKQL